MAIVDIARTRSEQEAQPQRSDEAREEWRTEARGLIDQVAQWVRSRSGWSVTSTDITVTEGVPETSYSLPRLMIVSPDGELILEPIGNHVWGADGRIDLSAYPGMSRGCCYINGGAAGLSGRTRPLIGRIPGTKTHSLLWLKAY